MKKYEVKKSNFVDMMFDYLMIERVEGEEYYLFLHWLNMCDIEKVEIKVCDDKMSVEKYLREVIRKYGEWESENWLDGCYVNSKNLSEIWEGFYKI